MKHYSRSPLKHHHLPKHYFAEQPTTRMTHAELMKCCSSWSNTVLKVGAMHKTGTYEVQASPDRLCDNSVLATQKVECIDTS